MLMNTTQGDILNVQRLFAILVGICTLRFKYNDHSTLIIHICKKRDYFTLFFQNNSHF